MYNTAMLAGDTRMVEPNFADKTIWTGDNLDILRGLNSDTVDLIYLDPPFNSNQDYAAPVGSKAAGAAFKDTWTLSDLDVAWMGLIADEQPAVANLLDTARLTHGRGMQSYLTMMAVRLLEMRRVLKETGSIYLHCDPTASHYLKLLIDAVFGAGQFRNEITWKRTHSHGDPQRKFGAITDTLLLYSKSNDYKFMPQYRPFSQEYIGKTFTGTDPNGRRWQSVTLRSPNPRPNLTYPYEASNGVTYQPHRNGWSCDPQRMKKYEREGRLHFPTRSSGALRLKMYLDESPGAKTQNLWDDIPPISANAQERIGFPTQKPLALLERIISASSNEGDVVLDPFAGCATACVAAEKLGRQWIGIDLSPKAVELVNIRLRDFMGDLFHHGYVTARTDIPRRTDIDAPVHYRKNKHVLFGQQEGRCGGCRMDFPFKLYEVDHIVPVSRGGGDHLDNLQLLCSHCNRIKGDREQSYLVARLKEYAYAEA